VDSEEEECEMSSSLRTTRPVWGAFTDERRAVEEEGGMEEEMKEKIEEGGEEEEMEEGGAGGVEEEEGGGEGGEGGGGNKRKRNTKTEAQDLMDELMKSMEATRIDNHIFSRHRTIKTSKPTTVVVCVATKFFVALNQAEKRLDVHTLAYGEAGGLTVTRIVPLEDSDGYNLSALPLFSHTLDALRDGTPYVAALDHLGRVKVWDADTGKLLSSEICPFQTNLGDTLAFTEAATFAVSSTHLVVMRPETLDVATVTIRQWLDIPVLGKYGAAETRWDQFQQRVNVPEYVASSVQNPFE
jgi:hypothetical protein